MLIGIAGKKRCGKDTVAKIIAEQLGEASILHFADALKLEVAVVTGFSIKYIDEHKENFRLILQGWGTDFRRKIYGTDYWIEKLDDIIREPYRVSHNVIISDVRFQNEYDYVKEHNGIMIRVERSLDYTDNHISETELDNAEYDYTIRNFGTEEQLREAVLKIVTDITKEQINQNA